MTLHSFTITGTDAFYEVYIHARTIHRIVRTPFDSDCETEVKFEDLDEREQDRIAAYIQGDYV